MGTVILQELQWDSEFFGFRVGKLQESGQPVSAFDLLAQMKASGFRLVYWDSTNPQDELIRYHVIDQVLLEADQTLSTASVLGITSFTVRERPKSYPDSQIIDLALQAGWSSRFRVDPGFSEDQFRRMYETWIRRSCMHEIADCILTVDDGPNCAGFLSLSLRNGCAHVSLMAVSPKYRQQGIGRLLLKDAARYSAERGCSRMRVVTQSNNFAALRLYEGSGFQPVDVRHWYHFWADDCG